MKTLNDIREGFFKNIGVSQKLNIELIKDYFVKLRGLLDRSYRPTDTLEIRWARTHLSVYRIDQFIKMCEEASKANESHEGFWSIDRWTPGPLNSIYISPETVGDIDKLPDWFNFKEMLNVVGTNKQSDMSIYICGMPRLKDVNKLFDGFTSIYNLSITDCPKIDKSILKKFPKRVYGNFVFKPSDDVTMTNTDIAKAIPGGIEGDIYVNRKDGDYNTQKPSKNTKPTNNDTPASQETPTSQETPAAPKVRLKLVPVNDPKDAPVFTVNAKNKVFNAEGIEIGRLSRDRKTVYRDVNKIMTVGDDGYGYNMKGKLICILSIENV